MKYNGKEYYSQGDIYKAIEQENKKLKENIAWYEKEEDRLKKEISSYVNKNHILYGNCEDSNNENKFLRKENRKLKEKTKNKYKYKTITIDDSSPYESSQYRELEKMIEENGWEIYQSGVNTILKESHGYTYDNNITRFILKKEKED